MQNNQLNIDTTSMSSKQIRNMSKLMIKACDLGIKLDDSTCVGYNTMSGNTYLWSEWVGYSIFISDFDSTVKACYSCPIDGEETIRNCGNDASKLDKWAERLQRKSEKKEI